MLHAGLTRFSSSGSVFKVQSSCHRGKHALSEVLVFASTYDFPYYLISSDFQQPMTSHQVEMGIVQVVEAQPDMPLDSSISLYVALLTFVLSVHSDQLEYVDQVLVCT